MRRNRWSAPGLRKSRAVLPTVAALLLVGAPAAAQMVGPRMATRAELERMRDSLEAAAAATRDGDRRLEITNQLGGLRVRLERGDLEPGDVVVLTVPDAPKWTDTFTVSPERTLELPDIAPIPLAGLLHAELEERLARELSAYVREPRLQVAVLKRIGILGAVAQPGFYNLPGSMLISDAVMQAGGPASNAKLRKLKIRRFGDEKEIPFRQVAFQSLSLDQLGVISGDELFVPAGGGGRGLQIMAAVLGAAGSIALIATRF